MFEVRQYTKEQVLEWDNFVQRSKQGTFLFNRSYMDYHADRFLDCSLMVYRKGRLYALLPANKVDTTLYSHQGLTYGGLLTNTKACAEDICEVFLAINEYLNKQGFKHVVYKSIPWIYHKYPAEEDLYALLNVCKARLTIRDISTTIPLPQHLKFTESRKSGIRKAIHSELTIAESEDMEAFWRILNDNLSNKYNTHPVHSLAELTLLKSRCPKSIRLLIRLVIHLAEPSSSRHHKSFTHSIYLLLQRERASVHLIFYLITLLIKCMLTEKDTLTLVKAPKRMGGNSMLLSFSKRKALVDGVFATIAMSGMLCPWKS